MRKLPQVGGCWVRQTNRSQKDVKSNFNPDSGVVTVSTLNFVDLAGSERQSLSLTQAEGVRLNEGKHINKSLLFLVNVVKQLSEAGSVARTCTPPLSLFHSIPSSSHSPKTFINYRNSKLTQILKNSLSGNSKTAIVCTVNFDYPTETMVTWLMEYNRPILFISVISLLYSSEHHPLWSFC